METTDKKLEQSSESTKQEASKAINELHEAFLTDDTSKLGELYHRKDIPEEVKLEIGNASKVRNRNAIVSAITKLVHAFGRMPSPLEISIETGLSITSVYKHLREMKTQELEEEEMLILNAQRANLLGIIIKAALPVKGKGGKIEKEGDPKSAKLALDLINGYSKQVSPVTNITNIDIKTVMELMFALPKSQQEVLQKNMVHLLGQAQPSKNESAAKPGDGQNSENSAA